MLDGSSHWPQLMEIVRARRSATIASTMSANEVDPFGASKSRILAFGAIDRITSMSRATPTSRHLARYLR